ncbi:glutamate receptor ionotropic, kainate 2-like [Ptychodera flava]|uniref:glutamate receptor ionotropic, kainate 2-like n=1 Tax=Ptychodera flava TaxID=63121 RepID=UPI00396A37B6
MELSWIWLIACLTILQLGSCLPTSVRIGGIFAKQSPASDAEKAFKFAINKMNKHMNIAESKRTHITYDIQLIEDDNTFDATKKVCRQLDMGVAAVFGPPSSRASLGVQSVLDEVEVPHIEARWDHRRKRNQFSINLYPDPDTISKAIADTVDHYKWNKIAILYQNEDSLIRLQDVLKLSAHQKTKISIRQLIPPNFKPVLKEIKASGLSHIIVDCDFENVLPVLEQALEVQMLTSLFHYFFTTPDLHLLNLERYSEGDVNITSLRLLHTTEPKVQAILTQWRDMLDNEGAVLRPREMTTEEALMYDAVDVFANALQSLDHTQTPRVYPLSCQRPNNTWHFGHSLFNQLTSVGWENGQKMHNFHGLTGKIEIGDNGIRSYAKMDMLELHGNELLKVGHWEPHLGTNVTMKTTSKSRNETSILKNRTLIVTTIEEDPYLRFKSTEDGKTHTGNDRFEGFCVDLLKAIADIVKFEYEIRIVPDGRYGGEVSPGVWNGMVGQLVERKADLAVAPLTISYIREKVMDFAKPFMNTGISILYRVPESKNPGVFSFLSPLDFDIWLYMLLAYLGVSVMLFILARFTPYEWYNPHPCNPEYDMVENQFNLMNSLWFSFGGLMQQGSEVNPRALSTRVISGMWWFFSLIIISSYTANLAAFLTVERMVSPIKDVDDLASQTKIEYGTLADGSTAAFFKNSEIELYKRMWSFMDSRKPSVFVKTTEEGIKRVLSTKNYAFLLESNFNEYHTARNCNLTQIGGLLDSKFYGIGTPLGAPYRDEITSAILKLQEGGQIQKFKKHWWYSAEGACERKDKKQEANSLGFENIGGIFFVLLGGLILGVICALGEFVWKSRQNAELDRKSICAEMGQELSFAMRCRTKKPLHGELEEKYLEMVQTGPGGGQRHNQCHQT